MEKCIEILIVFCFALCRIWIPGTAGKCFGYAGLGIIVLGWIYRKETCEKLGLINWWYALAGAALFAGKLLYGKHLLGNAAIPKQALFLLGYLGWALFQMLVMNAFFAKHISDCGFRAKATAVATGAIFALFHYPNPLLVPLTFVGGSAFAYAFLRMKKKNLYLLAATQVLAAAITFYTFPAALHHNFRVGEGYYTWTPQQK